MEAAFIIEKSVIIITVFALTMLMAMYSTWAERKVAAWLQDRIGPNRAGWAGLLQPLADGAKLFTKEEFFPNTPNRFLFILGPGIAMSTALITSAVIPWGDTIEVFGQRVLLQATDIDVSVLYIFGVLSIGVYGIMIGAWASNNKYSLMSAVRASSQMISYEVAMGLSMIAKYGTKEQIAASAAKTPARNTSPLWPEASSRQRASPVFAFGCFSFCCAISNPPFCHIQFCLKEALRL
jgi:NADH-quinone oxidoreductase subunit H